VTHGPQKNPLDFGGNLDHVMLGLVLGRLELRLTLHVTPGRTMLPLDEGRVISRNTGCV